MRLPYWGLVSHESRSKRFNPWGCAISGRAWKYPEWTLSVFMRFFPQIKKYKKGVNGLWEVYSSFCAFSVGFYTILNFFLGSLGPSLGGAKRGADKLVPPQKKDTQRHSSSHAHFDTGMVSLRLFCWSFACVHSFGFHCLDASFSTTRISVLPSVSLGVENSSKQCCPHHQPHINMYLTSHAARGLSLCIPSDCGTMECSASVEPKMMRPDGDGHEKRGLLLSGSEGKKWSVGCHR